MVAGILALKCHNEQSQSKEVAGKLLGFLFIPLTGLAVSSDPGPRISSRKQLSFGFGVLQ